jgi:hypothetical protein
MNLRTKHFKQYQEPILRLLILQLQSHRCSRQIRALFSVEENIFGFKTLYATLGDVIFYRAGVVTLEFTTTYNANVVVG